MNKIIDMILELGFIDTRTSGLVNSLSHFTLFRKLVKSQLDILEIWRSPVTMAQSSLQHFSLLHSQRRSCQENLDFKDGITWDHKWVHVAPVVHLSYHSHVSSCEPLIPLHSPFKSFLCPPVVRCCSCCVCSPLVLLDPLYGANLLHQYCLQLSTSLLMTVGTNNRLVIKRTESEMMTWIKLLSQSKKLMVKNETLSAKILKLKYVEMHSQSKRRSGLRLT